MTTERTRWVQTASLTLSWFLMILAAQGLCYGQDIASEKPPGQRAVPDNLPWEPMPASEVMPILEILSGQCTGNLQRLMTWEGSFNCTLHQRVRKTSLPAEYAKKIQPADIVWLRQESIFDVEFAADLVSNRLFNSKQTKKFRYVDDRTGKLILDNLTAYDENSAFTQDHFVRFAPKEIWGGYIEVGDGEKPRLVHLGFQEAPVKSRIENNLGIANPSVLFGFSSVRKFGEELSFYRDLYSGKNGREIQAFLREHLKVFSSPSPAGRLYKIETAMKQPPEGSPRLDHMQMIFTPEAGYNPISLLFESETDGGARRPRIKAEWSWQSTNGIFVPSRVAQAVFLPDTGELSYESTLVLGRSVLNSKLDDSRFSYEAIGMVNGDVLDDTQTQTRYKYMNGKLEKLSPDAIHPRADFEPKTATDNFGRTRLMVGVSTVFALLFAFALVRARASRLRATT